MAKVVFNNVTKRFDTTTIALQHFNLTIQEGEFMVLVGPSGCGKSTALRLLAGLEAPTEGEILIDNQVVNQLTPQQRNIAMVFQNYALYPHMSVRANLAFPLKMRGVSASAITEKITQIADLLDLSPLLERKPKQLSGGQRQRVAMGRALVRNPSVFLLDEPLSNLDAKLRAQIRADIAQLQKNLNKTTLYVTHDQIEAMTLGDRVAVMNKGTLQQVGTPEALYQEPQNIFVARFLGNPGMNIFPSRLTFAHQDYIILAIGQQNITLPLATQKCPQGLLQRRDQSIFLGIRPEAFHTSPENHPVAIKIIIHSVEFLGHESLVYCQLPGIDGHDTSNRLIARFVGQFHPQNHPNKTFFIAPEAIYLFDKQGDIIRRL